MVRILSLIAFIMLVCCQGQKKSQEDSRKLFFDATTESLSSLPVGFSVFGNDLSMFATRIFDEESNLIPNPHLKYVSDSALVLLSNKYPPNISRTYYFVSKMKVGNHFLLMLMQEDTSKNEYWMKLNLFSNGGNLIDTMTFAGQKVHQYEVFGVIDKKLNIETRSYHNIEIDTTFSDKYHYRYFATEVKKRYVIEDSCFRLVEMLKERALFTDVSDRKIVTRVDTLNFYY